MTRIFTRLGFTAVALVAGSGIVAHAQTATTGAVTGVVSDKSGAPVSGATVRLTSTQTSRTFVTGADGFFRVGLLNPGAWTVEVTKSGFQKITQNISVLVNQTQPTTFKMAPEGATVVEVLGTTALVDTTTTQTGLVTTMDNLASIPKGRDMSSIAFLAPGVVTSGFGNDPSIGGGSGAENSYIVDGLSTTNTSRGFQGTELVTDFIDQVEIQTGGFKPEFSALGGVFNAITKSGSNQLKGSTWLTWDPIGISAVPVRGTYYKQPSAPTRYDIGAEVGGPIIKDKLFFFAGFDLTKTETNQANNLPNLNGMVNGKQTIDAFQFIGKINWMITQDHQITFSANLNNTKDNYPTIYPATLGTAQFGYDAKDTVRNLVLNYDWTITPSLFLSAKLGTTEYKSTTAPTDSTTVNVADTWWAAWGPGVVQPSPWVGLTFSRGGTGYYVPEEKTQTTQAKVDLSWFVGNHNMKFGISQLESKYSELAATSGGHRDNLLRVSGSSLPGSLYQTYLSTDASVKAVWQAFYAQDTWDVGSGVKLMYGFRFETQDQKDMNNRSFMKFDDFKDYMQPRLGLTWDVNQDGKTKVSVNYAKYFEAIPQRLAIRVYANETYIRYRYASTQYTFTPATGAYALIPNAVYNRVTDFATPFSYDPIAEGTKLPERNEYVLGLDHTFASGWTAGIHARYRELKNPLEDMVFTDAYGAPYDEGPAIDFVGTPSQYGVGAAVIGNPGAFQQWRPNPKSMTLWLLGQGITTNNWGINILDYYNPATGLFTVPNTGYEKAGNKYASVDFTLDKKTDRSTFNFSYTWSRLQGNYEGVVSSSNGQADGNITASFDYYPYVGYGLLPNDRTHVIKMFASHRFDVFGGDLNLGFNWTYQSGTPVSLFDDGSTTNGRTPGDDTLYGPLPGTLFLDIGGYGNAVPANGQLGQYGRTPALNNVDLHLDWAYKFGGKYRLIPSIDLFNAFNTRYAATVRQQATDNTGVLDPRWGHATTWQQGRRYRFGVKFQF
ncbi:MAG: TonB-dependent receptor [Geothrix sp.]|nr:TonB-dependent receptor [Geothrix sp.]